MTADSDRTRGAHQPSRQVTVLYFAVLGFWLLIPILIHQNVAQDALPFVVAPEIARDHPDDVYTLTGDLFSPPRRFFDRACALAPAGTDCANETVAFISPPPALLVGGALSAFGASAGSLLFRFVASASLAGGMWALWNRLSRLSPSAGAQLLATAVLMTPFVMVPVSLGQNGPVMFLSAALGVSGSERWRRAAGVGSVLALTVLFKFSPIVLLGVLVWQRRWKFLAVTVGVLAGATALTAVLFPTSLFSTFVTATRALPPAALGNPYNGAVDAVLFTVSAPLVQGTVGSAVLLVARVAIAAAGLWWVHRRAGADAVWSYAWVVLLLFLPMVWWHYLFVALAALAYAIRSSGRADRLLVLLPIAAAITIPISLPNGQGSAVPWAQALFLLAVVAAVPVLVRDGDRRDEAAADRTLPVS